MIGVERQRLVHQLARRTGQRAALLHAACLGVLDPEAGIADRLRLALQGALEARRGLLVALRLHVHARLHDPGPRVTGLALQVLLQFGQRMLGRGRVQRCIRVAQLRGQRGARRIERARVTEPQVQRPGQRRQRQRRQHSARRPRAGRGEPSGRPASAPAPARRHGRGSTNSAATATIPASTAAKAQGAPSSPLIASVSAAIYLVAAATGTTAAGAALVGPDAGAPDGGALLGHRVVEQLDAGLRDHHALVDRGLELLRVVEVRAVGGRPPLVVDVRFGVLSSHLGQHRRIHAHVLRRLVLVDQPRQPELGLAHLAGPLVLQRVDGVDAPAARSRSCGRSGRFP